VIAVANRQFPVSSQMDARRQGRMTTIVVTRRARCRSRELERLRGGGRVTDTGFPGRSTPGHRSAVTLIDNVGVIYAGSPPTDQARRRWKRL